MEIFELRYFLAVAEDENLHRAAERIHVSPGSLSKAIQRLEEELSVKLFSREGRNIYLSDYGKLLQKKASEIIHLEESARLTIGGHQGSIQVVITGPEILLSEMGVAFTRTLKKKYPRSRFEFHHSDDDVALGKVERGEAHIAIVSSEVPASSRLHSKLLAEPSFQTYAGKNHPLYGIKTKIPVEKILENSFVSPNSVLFGQVSPKQSLDGWRDDQFPRKIEYLASSLKVLEECVQGGLALAYLPDYYGERLNLHKLNISGCPYICTQKVRLVSRNPKELSWLHQVL